MCPVCEEVEDGAEIRGDGHREAAEAGMLAAVVGSRFPIGMAESD